MSEVELDGPETELDLSQVTSVDSLKRYKVATLKTWLSQRGLSSSGKKEELIKRLWEWIQAEEALRMAEEEDQLQEPTRTTISSPQMPSHAPVVKSSQPMLSQQHANQKPTYTELSKTFIYPKNDPLAALASAATINAETKKVFTTEEAKKRQSRAERFGIVPETDKLKKRAERFGYGSSGYQSRHHGPKHGESQSSQFRVDMTKPEELEKMRQRKERFGGQVTSKALASVEDAEVKKLRAQRFGPQ